MQKIIRVTTVSQSIGFYKELVPKLQKDYEVVGVSSPEPELEQLAEMGVKTIEVPMERHISPLKDLKSLWQMIKVFSKRKAIYRAFDDSKSRAF